MLNVALTGNAAAGKSSVVRWFASWGAAVIDADALVRAAQQPGTPTFAAIVRVFGEEILRADGSLDRAALRAKVLESKAALASLNEIVHPAVRLKREELTAQAATRGIRVLVNDIPLLFEVLAPADFDLVVLVDAPVAVRRERLLGRGLSPQEADQLIASQLPSDIKRRQADIVIDNDGSLEDLRASAEKAWREIVSRLDAPSGGSK
jgi:dephospho-CoA kinase